MDFCLDWAELRVPNRLCGDGHGAGEQGPGPNQGSSSVNHFQVKGVVGTMQCFGSLFFPILLHVFFSIQRSFDTTIFRYNDSI